MLRFVGAAQSPAAPTNHLCNKYLPPLPLLIGKKKKNRLPLARLAATADCAPACTPPPQLPARPDPTSPARCLLQEVRRRAPRVPRRVPALLRLLRPPGPAAAARRRRVRARPQWRAGREGLHQLQHLQGQGRTSRLLHETLGASLDPRLDLSDLMDLGFFGDLVLGVGLRSCVRCGPGSRLV